MRILYNQTGPSFRKGIIENSGLSQEDIVEITHLSRSQISKEINSAAGFSGAHREIIWYAISGHLKKAGIYMTYDEFWCVRISLQKVK